MKFFFCFLLVAIILIACKKDNASTQPKDIEVQVYATHANDTIKIVSTDPVHLTLK